MREGLTSAYGIRAKVWFYQGKAAWHFVTLPVKTAAQIKKRYGMFAKGWQSLPVTMTVGKTEWNTSIFLDKKRNSYLLPLTAAVRKAENLKAGAMFNGTLRIRWQKLED